jgi:hypothetical protein
MTAPPPSFFTQEEQQEQEDRKSRLVDAIAGGETVAFVGAGCSISAGYPSGEELVKRLLENATGKKKSFVLADHPSLAVQIESIKICLIDEYEGLRDKALRPRRKPGVPSSPQPNEHEITPLHLDLAGLPFRGILTTNYDEVLEDALERVREGKARPTPVCCFGGARNLAAESVRAISSKRPIQTIIHLHGLLRFPPTMVCASSEYQEAYGFDFFNGEQFPGPSSASFLAASLFALLFTRRMVFVGFSLTDDYVMNVIQRLTGSTWSWGSYNHFAIMPLRSPEDKKEARRLLEHHGIAVIFFQCVDDNYGGLDLLIRDIAERVTSKLEGGSTAPSMLRPVSDFAPIIKPVRWVDEVNARELSKDVSGED